MSMEYNGGMSKRAESVRNGKHGRWEHIPWNIYFVIFKSVYSMFLSGSEVMGYLDVSILNFSLMKATNDVEISQNTNYD